MDAVIRDSTAQPRVEAMKTMTIRGAAAELIDVYKSNGGSARRPALAGVSTRFERRTFSAVMGPFRFR
jgi:hypothetical protein